MHLSREIILDASFAILEQYGLADMTMRRLANQMGVAPGAMYWHFKNKQELIDATARVILTPILEEEYETLEDAATDLRERLLEFRDGAELVGASLIDEDLRGELLDTLTSTLDTPIKSIPPIKPITPVTFIAPQQGPASFSGKPRHTPYAKHGGKPCRQVCWQTSRKALLAVLLQQFTGGACLSPD